MTDKQKKKRPLRKTAKCPYCEYTCKGTQGIGRHIHYKHPEKKKNKDDVIEIKASTLEDLLRLNHELARRQRKGLDYSELEKELEEQDVKLRLNLVAVSMAKSERITVLQLKLQELDEILWVWLEKEMAKKKFPSKQLMSIRRMLSSDIRMDVDFLKSILSIKEGDESTFFSRLVSVLARADSDVTRMLVGKGKTFGLVEMVNNVQDREFQNDLVKNLLRTKRVNVHEVKENAGSTGKNNKSGVGGSSSSNS